MPQQSLGHHEPRTYHEIYSESHHKFHEIHDWIQFPSKYYFNMVKPQCVNLFHIQYLKVCSNANTIRAHVGICGI